MLRSSYLEVVKKLTGTLTPDNLNQLFQALLEELKTYLELDPFYNEVKIIIRKEFNEDPIIQNSFFNIGVERNLQDSTLEININNDYIRFIPFILLREAFNCFIPNELVNFESIQLVINQLILKDLSKFENVHEWRKLVRRLLEQHDLLTIGFNRLISFDRLANFFNLQSLENNPTQFFFEYIRRNSPLIRNKMDSFQDILEYEYGRYVSSSIYNIEILETLWCLIKIFYKVKNYKDLLSFKNYFKQYKEEKLIETDLSIRNFIQNMSWIKNFSYISPSYQVNWKTLNICLLNIILRFNPLLKKKDILKLIKEFPFLSTPKITRNTFAFDLSGYIVIPKIYLDDFMKFIAKLESFGYIINQFCLLWNKNTHFLNLNYFKQYSKTKRMINPLNRYYNNKYEIEFEMDYGDKYYNNKLTLFEFLLLDRIRFYSINSFGFERRNNTLNILKSDLLNEITDQQVNIRNFKTIFKIFHDSSDLRREFLSFLELNRTQGFFFIKAILIEYITILKLLDEILINNYEIRNLDQIHKKVKNFHFLSKIEDSLNLNTMFSHYSIFKELFPLNIESRHILKKKIEKYKIFYDLIHSCYNLKVFNLNEIRRILKEQNLVQTIYEKKEEKLKKFYEKYKFYKITGQRIDNVMDRFLSRKPQIVQPLMINTIKVSNLVKDHIQLILIKSKEILNKLEKLKKFFPRILINDTINIFSNEPCYFIEISMPYLRRREKKLFFSILHNLFGDEIIYGNTYLWSGTVQAISSKNFYDFQNKRYFYTKALFEQYFLYLRSIFGKGLSSGKITKNKFQQKFWSKKVEISNLIKKIDIRASKEKYINNPINLEKLLAFHLNLKPNLMNINEFKSIKIESFFTDHIKSIKFLPAFQNFGFNQYFLYMRPTNINAIDFKLIFSNNFQSVKFLANIDKSNSILIKYITPYNAPNLSYLNWLVKSKKIIREFCGFFIKKVQCLFHLKFNLTHEGWNYNANRFKIHMQKILFNSDNLIEFPEIREFNLTNLKGSLYFKPNSPELESLYQIYNWRSIDIKSYLGTKKQSTINHIIGLLNKDLIFPYLSLKNIGLQDKIYIILPDLNRETIDKLKKIFSFFNYGFIYEIEGQYFIHGFPTEKQFKNGLMIEVYLPECELSELERVFDLLFEYLKINDYLILNDLIQGDNLIESVFNGSNFLNSYNPLKNFKWDKKTEKWINPKLFNEKFEPIYPELLPKV